MRHKPVSEFILESALGAANEVLAERYHFGLDAKQWEEFQTALDAPTRSLPRIEKLTQEVVFLID